MSDPNKGQAEAANQDEGQGAATAPVNDSQGSGEGQPDESAEQAADGEDGAGESESAEPYGEGDGDESDEGEESGKVVDLNATPKSQGSEPGDEEPPPPEILEIGPADAVKVIYALQIPGAGFMEKVQGIELLDGVLVRWNSTATFFEGARMDPADDGSYVLRR